MLTIVSNIENQIYYRVIVESRSYLPDCDIELHVTEVIGRLVFRATDLYT